MPALPARPDPAPRRVSTAGTCTHCSRRGRRTQFLWAGTNLHTDRYGGPSVTDRATFVAEVTQAVREAAGPDFVISVRISQWKESNYDAKIVEGPAELGQLIPLMRSAGAGIFHASSNLVNWSKPVA